MNKLAELRAKLKEAETRGSDNNRGSTDNSVYPFWNLKEGGESVLRFLPDRNDKNSFFWVERAMIKLPFHGIKGETDTRQTIVQVPCMEMYNESCPILNEVRGWFKNPSLEDLGRKYWKKKSYVFQGFVPEDGLNEQEQPENPIRRLIIGPQIFTLIKSALVDPELDDLPTDYVHGLDFRLKKSSKGGFADYSTSSWSRRERPLNEKETAAIEQYGLFNLSDFLPKKPTEVELKVMAQMFEASVNGDAFDMERWGAHFRPAGANQRTGDPVKTTAPKVQEDSYDEPAPVQTETVTPTAPTSESASGDNRAQDILAMIRNRNTQN
jgi:hypothetical protein